MRRVLAAIAVLVVAFGALYGAVSHTGVWDGIYFAVVTVTTVGYGDIIPHGWAPHVVALAIMVLIIPAWSAVFSLLTTGFITARIDKRHEEMKQHVTSQTGGSQ